MYHRSGTLDAATGRRFVSLTRWQYFSAWNNVMVVVLKVWRQIENPTAQSMRIYVKNIPAKFPPDPIWKTES